MPGTFDGVDGPLAAALCGSLYSVDIMPTGVHFALFHHGALGDFVLTFPMMRALAPATVALVATTSRGRLAARCLGHVRGVDADKPHFVRLFGPEGDADIAGLAGDLGQPDWIISFVCGPEDPWARRMKAALPEARLACIDPRPPAGWLGHVTSWHARQLLALGLALDPVSTPVRRTPGDGVILLHAGSGGLHKCWPHDRWLALVALLRRAGRPVEIIYGEAEQERWSARQQAAWDRAGATCVQTLDDLYARLLRCCTFIGHDAGPTHLAAQLGVATLALFGPTSPRCWAPLGPVVRILAPAVPSAMTWLSVEAVASALSQAR